MNKLGLQNNPVITGLWQVADLEREGNTLDPQTASDAILDYVNDGFTCFDMADHYGSAELIAGAARNRLSATAHPSADQLRLYTKWCPQPHETTFELVKSGVMRRIDRLAVDCIDLLQLHWWSFDHPGYIDVMDHLSRLQQDGLIRHLGVTNFDTDHLHVLHSCGFEIASNQVCASVLDRRALAEMSQFCQSTGVRLLCYGTLAGGFISERWLGVEKPHEIADWSKMKYLRFIDATGGWAVFQQILQTLDTIARRHEVSIANVATRWVLDQPSVAGIIVGARLTENQHRESNKALLQLKLGDDDIEQINQHQHMLTAIPGDCGSEYRRPPFLTASGDLSHHLDALPPVYQREEIAGFSNRFRISSGSEFEPVCGYSRGTRFGNRILISGTTATHGADRVIGKGDPRAQMIYIMDKIAASIASLGGNMKDVVRTRIYLTDYRHWEVVSRVHGRYFADVLPANTLIEVSNLIGDYVVEVEAEAIVEP